MTDIPIKKSDIARSFSLAAPTYDNAAFVQKEIGKRLIERLDLLKTPPARILDGGAGTGYLTRLLQAKFPQSHIIGLDLALGMMQFAKRKTWQVWKRQPTYLCADLECLPFTDQSFDLIFSNFSLQWCFSLPQVFAEFKRILKPNGMLFFTTVGPQTLFELRHSWQKVSPTTHVNNFLDMHDVGDFLHQAKLSDPVMDMEMIQVTYPHVKDLLHDLKASGARNMNFTRTQGCTPKQHLAQMIKAYAAFQRADGLYPATFEIIYGHAFRKATAYHQRDSDGIVRIPGNKIPLARKFLAKEISGLKCVVAKIASLFLF